MQQENIRIGGAVVFWKLEPEFSRMAIAQGFSRIGMDDYIPNERPDGQCLKESLAGEYSFMEAKGTVIKVESLKEKGAFEVVAVEKGHNENYYRQVCWAKASKDGSEISLFNTNGHSDNIRERFAARKAVISGSQVSSSLVNMLTDRYAVSLRPNGGLYWIPGSLIGWWGRVCQSIESASGGGDKTALFCLSTVHNPDMVRAVTAGIAEEVDAVMRDIQNEMDNAAEKSSDDLHKVRQKAQAMADRLKSYEVHVGASLDGLRKGVEEASTASAMAMLSAVAREHGVTLPA